MIRVAFPATESLDSHDPKKMSIRVQARGDYELFETTKAHRILVLGERWYAWVEGDQGEILVPTDSDHQKQRTLQQGRFFMVDFDDDPEFKDMPHLFLEREGRYAEYMVPKGLPGDGNAPNQIIETDHTLAKDELEGYLDV